MSRPVSAKGMQAACQNNSRNVAKEILKLKRFLMLSKNHNPFFRGKYHKTMPSTLRIQ
jgi:hypothetical protein